MNVYYKNEIASITGPDVIQASSTDNILIPMLELTAEFKDWNITLLGTLDGVSAVDSFCIANTNAFRYKLEINGEIFEGYIEHYTTIHDFDLLFAKSFTLELVGNDPLYIGHLFLGKRVILPRFLVEPEFNTGLRGESSRSFGGQAFGLQRKTLNSFSVNYHRLTNEEKNLLTEYVTEVQGNIPHIIDLYPGARDQFPPMYATVSASELPFTKRNENGFYFSGSLSWQEAR